MLVVVLVALVVLVAVTSLTIAAVGLAGRLRTLSGLLLTTRQRLDTARRVRTRAGAARAPVPQPSGGPTRTYDVARP